MARQGNGQRRSRNSSERDERQADAHTASRAAWQCGRESERRQGRAVDQAEHDERKEEHTQTGGTGTVAADDRDPHRVVEAPLKHEPDQRIPVELAQTCESIKTPDKENLKRLRNCAPVSKEPT
jgi:hypothetical protein